MLSPQFLKQIQNRDRSNQCIEEKIYNRFVYRLTLDDYVANMSRNTKCRPLYPSCYHKEVSSFSFTKFIYLNIQTVIEIKDHTPKWQWRRYNWIDELSSSVCRFLMHFVNIGYNNILVQKWVVDDSIYNSANLIAKALVYMYCRLLIVSLLEEMDCYRYTGIALQRKVLNNLQNS